MMIQLLCFLLFWVIPVHAGGCGDGLATAAQSERPQLAVLVSLLEAVPVERKQLRLTLHVSVTRRLPVPNDEPPVIAPRPSWMSVRPTVHLAVVFTRRGSAQQEFVPIDLGLFADDIEMPAKQVQLRIPVSVKQLDRLTAIVIVDNRELGEHVFDHDEVALMATPTKGRRQN